VISLRDVSHDDKDRLGWKWVKGPPIDASEFGDPVSMTDYAVCVFDTDEGTLPPQLVLDAAAPAGEGWEPTATGFRYRSPGLAPDGLRSIVLKAGAYGKARLVVKGRGPNLGLPPTLDDLNPPVTVQLRTANGPCWDAEYKNRFRAHVDGVQGAGSVGRRRVPRRVSAVAPGCGFGGPSL
jgi:hypothetical protein